MAMKAHVVDWREFARVRDSHSASFIMMDESIRRLPDTGLEFYLMSAVQIRSTSAQDARLNLDALRDSLVAISSPVNDRPHPYWHTTEQLRSEKGRAAFTSMCTQVGKTCTVHVGIASVEWAKSDLHSKRANTPLPRTYARGRAFAGVLQQIPEKTDLIVADHIRIGGKNSHNVHSEDTMSADLSILTQIRRRSDYPALSEKTHLVHTSQSSDPVLWSADIAAAAVSQALKGNFSYVHALTHDLSALVVCTDAISAHHWDRQRAQNKEHHTTAPTRTKKQERTVEHIIDTAFPTPSHLKKHQPPIQHFPTPPPTPSDHRHQGHTL